MRARTDYTTGHNANDELLINTAIKDLHLASDDPRAKPACRLMLAEIAVESNKTNAQAQLDAALAEPPTTADAAYLLSLASLNAEREISFAEQACALDGDDPLVHSRLALLYCRAGRVDEALVHADTLLALGKSRCTWMEFKAGACLRAGRYRDAIDYANQASAANPTWDRPYLTCAAAYLCLREYEKTIMYFSRAPDSPGAIFPWPRHHRATPLWILGRFDEAAADYRAMRRDTGLVNHADLRLYLVLVDQARELERRGESELAQQKLREAAQEAYGTQRVAATPWLHEIISCLQGQLAPEDLVDAVEEGNTERLCEACYYAGEACLLYNRNEEALQWYQRCVDTNLQIDPDCAHPDPMSEYHLALWRLDALSTNAPPSTQPAQP
ncbi:MAG: hypothetical protein JXO22_10460 [Phycisphaerae bacterium]|nr:hypothetical protein [Phycisphaerae bacterium]